MYNIYLSGKPDTKVTVHLNAVPSLRIPAEVMVGVGDKKKRYKAFLDKAFNEKQDLLRDLARVHLLGLQKGPVSLISHVKQKDYHGIVIREWLQTNHEFLDSILIYLFPGENIPKKEGMQPIPVSEELKAELQAMAQPAVNAPAEETPKLTENDMAQIHALIAIEESKDQQAT